MNSLGSRVEKNTPAQKSVNSKNFGYKRGLLVKFAVYDATW